MDIITLVGPRGVGKSTTGKELAIFLGYKYIDLDEYMNKVLKKEGRIGGYTAKYGWAAYMKELYKNLKSLLSLYKNKKIVLDCGGGAISSEFSESELNAKLLRKRSKIVLLVPHEDDEKGLKMLFERERKREFFKEWSDEKLRKKIREDYFSRLPGMKAYAHHIVHTKTKSPKKIAKEIGLLMK